MHRNEFCLIYKHVTLSNNRPLNDETKAIFNFYTTILNNIHISDLFSKNKFEKGAYYDSIVKTICKHRHGKVDRLVTNFTFYDNRPVYTLMSLPLRDGIHLDFLYKVDEFVDNFMVRQFYIQIKLMLILSIVK